MKSEASTLPSLRSVAAEPASDFVLSMYRRMLLQRCVCAGALWDHKEIWLHVDVVNKQAQKLYMGSGFAIKSQDSWYYILGRKRYLMQKTLPERQPQAPSDNTSVAGGSVRSDGVFVWDVQPGGNSSTSAVQTKSSDADG